MIINGGYQIVDLKDTALSSVSATITGVHEAIKNSKNKPIMLTGLKISTTKYNDTFVTCVPSGTSYILYLPLGYITITNANAVTYTANT